MSAEETKHFLRNGSDTAPAPAEALEWGRETQAKMVDLKFTDLLGSWQHMTLPLSAFDEEAFDEGLGFDGSSIRGWQGISESDMLLMPQAETAILDPFAETPTLSLLCEIVDPVTREPYGKEPRRSGCVSARGAGMVRTVERLGMPCESHHREAASGGQCEIDLRFPRRTRMADQVVAYRYVIKNVARRHGKTATFMPKPIFGDN